MLDEKSKLFSQIPSVSILLNSQEFNTLKIKFGEGLAKSGLRRILDETRKKISERKITKIPEQATLFEELKNDLTRLTQPIGRKAINATGILLHTGLGRAPYCAEALENLAPFNGYSVLQTDLESGDRSLREKKIENLLINLTGCEAATVVNNNAAATMLVLNALAETREVIVSRGQLIEIGGAFRLPDVMERSGAIMHEVGTTNRTHVKDYENALNENTGAIIHVHTSNYRVRGFSGTPNIRQICELRDQTRPELPVVDDLGSGALVSLSEFGLPNEPLVKDSIAAGADIACFSGDKLICGAQSGIICGKKEFISKIRRNPFSRMFRVDKMTLAVLEATLPHFINGDYQSKIPFYRMLSAELTDLEKKGAMLVELFENSKDFNVSVIDAFAYVGSGSIPDEGIPSKAVKITPINQSPNHFAKILRQNFPSIFCRLADDSLCFDMRTLLNDDFNILMRDIPKLLRLNQNNN